MNIKLLSLDTSTSATGVAKFVNGKYIDHDLLETDKKLKGDDKLNQMIQLIYQYIELEKPDIIVIEMESVTRNPQVQRMLTELIGAVRGKCISENIPFCELRPTEYRSIIVKKFDKKPKGRKRVDQKEWSLDIVNNTLKIPTESDDCSDAILLGYAYIQMFS